MNEQTGGFTDPGEEKTASMAFLGADVTGYRNGDALVVCVPGSASLDDAATAAAAIFPPAAGRRWEHQPVALPGGTFPCPAARPRSSWLHDGQSGRVHVLFRLAGEEAR